MIDSDRVLRALDGTMTEKQFIKAYDDAAGQRGGGLKAPPQKLQNTYKKFRKDSDFDTFCETMGLDSQRAKAAIGRMVVLLPKCVRRVHPRRRGYRACDVDRLSR
jgi:hypothetical protein